MKMKRQCIAAVLVFSLITTAHALAPTFCIEPQVSVHIGHLGEHLYVNNTSVQNPQLSYLNWETHPLWTVGIYGRAELLHFFLDIHFDAGITGTLGNMQDSDWFDLTNVKQSFSEGTNNLLNAWYTDAQFGYEIILADWISIAPTLGFSYHFISMTSPQGGTGSTDPNKSDGIVIPYDSDEAVICTTAQIDYWRESIQMWLGIQSCFTVTNWLSINAQASIAPVSSLTSVDHHYNNGGLFFTDKPLGFFHALCFATKAKFRLQKHFSLTLGVSYRTLFVITGDTYTSRQEGYLGIKNTSNYSGASENDCTIAIGIAFTF